MNLEKENYRKLGTPYISCPNLAFLLLYSLPNQTNLIALNKACEPFLNVKSSAIFNIFKSGIWSL